MKSNQLGSLLVVSLSAAGWGLSLLGDADPAVGGCLAPRDVAIDTAGALGPFWGNDEGDLLYSVLVDPGLVSEREALKVLPGDGGLSTVAEQGDTTGAFLGTEQERYTTFHAGALNDDGDVAFVASTAADEDDETTSFNETIARRALFFRRGGTRHRIARFGEDSPVLGNGDVPLPWASIFDASPSNRNPSFSEVVFSAQVLNDQVVPNTVLTGLFVWDEQSQAVSILALEGDASPTGGTFTNFGRTRINGNGAAAFFALVEPDGQPVEPSLMLRQPDGTVVRVAEFGADGDAGPNGGRLSSLKDFDLDDTGGVVFAAVVADGPTDAGIFHRAPGGALTTILLDGDTSALGGQFIDVSFSRVRSNASGEVVLGVPLTEDLDGDGIFAVDPAGPTLTPLALAPGLVAIAALGEGAAGYQLETETRTVIPADGTDEGPTDFRITKLDVKNSIAPRRDSTKVEGLFRLPVFGEGPGGPVTFDGDGVTVFSPDAALTGNDLQRIRKVIVRFGDDIGNELEFGLTGSDSAPGATFAFNGAEGGSPSVKLGKTGRSARWKFNSGSGKGKLAVDLAAGTFALKLGRGNVEPSFSPIQYRVEFTLQTEDDVAQSREPDASFFHRAVLLDADQPDFGSGRRVRSKGERLPGGTLFVDAVTVKRKLKVPKGAADPEVKSDTVKLTGTLRNCPGSTPPTTPGLSGDVELGDFQLQGINLERKGGSKYVFRSKGTPKVTLVVDTAGGTFKLKVSGADPLAQLVNADFSGAGGPNDAGNDVGGMTLPFRLSVARVYEASFDLPITRKKGGKVFFFGN